MEQIQKLGDFARSFGCEVRFDEPMSRHTTFRIGGPADLFVVVPDCLSLQKLCVRAADCGVPLIPLGNGSNLLVSDSGIRGAVVSFGGKIKEISLCGGTWLDCGAGASLAAACRFAQAHSLTGLEFAYGIPGSVGGAAFMNAGAYGHSVSEFIISCSHIALNGKTGTFRKKELNFNYRKSRYSCGKYLITGIRFRLERGDQAQISARMEELYSRRKNRQPLDLPSAGSVFKRPEGHYAGALIEQCGLKGRRVGGAAVSEKHAGFIVNLGGASCSDVRKLISVIQETVLRETGIRLECEVKMAGQFG